MVRNMAFQGFEKLRVYELSEMLSDLTWGIVREWDSLAKETMGRQLVRAADSVGANIAEGTGRGSFQDNRRFVRNARGSLYETRHWLRRAHRRRLLSGEQVKQLTPILDELGPKLNAYLRSIGQASKSHEREDPSEPFIEKGSGATSKGLVTRDK
jgi:four helix bundle protein